MPQFDPSLYPSQIFWLLVCVSVLILFVKYSFVPRMTDIFGKRENNIQNDLGLSKKMMDEQKALIDDYSAKLQKHKENAIKSREALIKRFEEKKETGMSLAQKHFFARRVALERESPLAVRVSVPFQDVLLKDERCADSLSEECVVVEGVVGAHSSSAASPPSKVVK
ncbi:MAG: hypothetical protein LBF72_01495 [Holosporales bacterium]|jgi:hypothetical protein|nr:hypothetical protein [Holosporales bacterium]